MKIAVDISQINRDKGGINHYLLELLQQLKNNAQHDFVLCARSEEELPFALPANFSWLIQQKIPRWLGGGWLWYLLLANKLRRQQVDLLLEATLNSASLFFGKTAVVIMDLDPLTNPQNSTPSVRQFYKLFLTIAARRAKHILALSQATKDNFLKLFPWYSKPITVTEAGLNAWVEHEPTEAELSAVQAKYNITPEYIFTLSTLQPRKNHATMLKAFAKVLKELPGLEFVIAGNKGWYYEELFQLVNDLGLANNVRFLGMVDETDLPALYKMADWFIFLSQDEGFGIPVIEARATGLPVLVSDIPVFRELELDNALYVDPFNVDLVSVKLRQLLKMPVQKPTSEFMQRYQWKRIAETVLTAVGA